MSLRPAILTAAVLLCGCASIDLPDLDMLDSAFRDSATDLESYPDVGDAPIAPTDMRSAVDWDAAAKAIVAQRRGFDAPPATAVPALTAEEIEALKAKVRAYKLDDPV